MFIGAQTIAGILVHEFVVSCNVGWIEIHPYKMKPNLRLYCLRSKDIHSMSSVGTEYVVATDFNPWYFVTYRFYGR